MSNCSAMTEYKQRIGSDEAAIVSHRIPMRWHSSNSDLDGPQFPLF